MTPELRKLLQNFNLDNYADCENLTLADWYTQFKFRELVASNFLPYSKAIPELLTRPLRPVADMTNLDYDPDDRLRGVEEVPLEIMRDIVEAAETSESINLPEPPPAEKSIIFQINDALDDKQIKSDFNELLKERRKLTGKFSPNKDIKKWIDFKILPYIDLCLIAMSIGHSDKKPYLRSPLFKMKNVDKHITYSEIAFLLFKDEIENKQSLVDGQRVRLTMRPMVYKVLQPKYLQIIGCHAVEMGETRFIKGEDSIVPGYGLDALDSFLLGQIDFADSKDKDSAYLVSRYKRDRFKRAMIKIHSYIDQHHELVNHLIYNPKITDEMTQSDWSDMFAIIADFRGELEKLQQDLEDALSKHE